ncbi:MAG: helix-turn-helix domain-containing protein [Bacillota bacterium]
MQKATMRAKAAAEYIDVSYWKLLELAKAGRIPHIRIDGRLLFRREALDKWLEQQEQASLKREPEQAIRGIRRLK